MSIESLIEETVRRMLREELPQILATASRPTDDRRVTVTEAAAAAGVSPATIKQWVADGKIHRFGDGKNQRYSLAEVKSLSPSAKPSPLSIAARADAIMGRQRHG